MGVARVKYLDVGASHLSGWFFCTMALGASDVVLRGVTFLLRRFYVWCFIFDVGVVLDRCLMGLCLAWCFLNFRFFFDCCLCSSDFWWRLLNFNLGRRWLECILFRSKFEFINWCVSFTVVKGWNDDKRAQWEVVLILIVLRIRVAAANLCFGLWVFAGRLLVLDFQQRFRIARWSAINRSVEVDDNSWRLGSLKRPPGGSFSNSLLRLVFAVLLHNLTVVSSCRNPSINPASCFADQCHLLLSLPFAKRVKLGKMLER